MPLQSQLFRGDAKLEAAAVSDPAHVVLGASGEHVRKIQQALIRLDGVALDPDGKYGPATANAVLAYKRKRNIVNRSYQTQADNIVGKMTMAALDTEMRAEEAKPIPPTRLESIPPPPLNLGDLGPQPARRGISAPFFGTNNQFVFPGLFDALPALVNASNPRMEIALNGSRRVKVDNGVGAILETKDARIAKVVNPDDPTQNPVVIRDNSQILEVQGSFRGRTDLIARTNTNPSQVRATLPVWHGMPGRTVSVAFHYLNHIRLSTDQKVGNERGFLGTMNLIYLNQANIFFQRASAAAIEVDGLRKNFAVDRILIDSPSNFGPDWDKFLAKRNPAAMINVYFVLEFETNESIIASLGGVIFGIADAPKAVATGRRDCMIRDNPPPGPTLGPRADIGITVAHEVGHLLGMKHTTGSNDLMFEGGATGKNIPPDQAVKIHEHLDTFPK